MKKTVAALAFSLLLVPVTLASAVPDSAPGPVRYHVVAQVVAQPCQVEPCAFELVDFTVDTEAEARDLARKIAIEGCWQPDNSGETVGRYLPAHRVHVVAVTLVGLDTGADRGQQ